MSLPAANPAFVAEVQRLARCFDAVPGIFAAALGVRADELAAVSDQWAWSFPGGALSVTWTDDLLTLFGGALGYDESAFAGEVHVEVLPTSENDSMSSRRAFAVLALRALDACGSMLAQDMAAIDLGPIRHVYPASDDSPAALLIIPFRLRIQLQTTLGVANEELTETARTQHL